MTNSSQYLLDTCAVSDFVKGEKGTLNKISLIPPSQVYISSISLMEIEYGLEINLVRAKKISSILKDFLDSLTVFHFDRQDALIAGKIRAFLKGKGSPIGACDVLLAGVAVNRKLILVTSNVDEFKRVPELEIENWRVH